MSADSRREGHGGGEDGRRGRVASLIGSCGAGSEDDGAAVGGGCVLRGVGVEALRCAGTSDDGAC